MINIYTAIFGGFDNLVTQPPIADVKYTCFTDNPSLQCGDWNIVVRDDILRNEEPRLRAKYFKVMSHEFFDDLSIWIDGNIQIRFGPKRYTNFIPDLSSYIKNGLALYKHPSRTCIYEEEVVSKGLRKYNNAKMYNQVEAYRKEGMPENFGLWACGVLFRNNDSKKINELWWNEITKYTIQDQLSFAYLVWKHKLDIGVIDRDIFDQRYFYLLRHLSKN